MEELEAAVIPSEGKMNDEESGVEAASEVTPVADKQIDDENAQCDTLPKETLPSENIIGEGQRSPLNKSKSIVYDREVLIKLRDDPNSKIKPMNLPDLDVVLKDNSRDRGAVDMRQFKDVGISRHDSPLFPRFVLSQSTRGLLALKRGSQGRAKSNKPVFIHEPFCLRDNFVTRETEMEIIKLRETDNPWKRGRGRSGDCGKQDVTAALYKKVRGVLNKLMPQTVNKLSNQVKALHIYSQEQLQGLVDLVFDKVVDEPKFMVAYALLCKELRGLQVSVASSRADQDDVNFEELIITRCMMEFEEAVEDAKFVKPLDPEIFANQRKKESQLESNEERRRFYVKFFCNIRFMGELFKQGMLTSITMHRCIRYLLTLREDENLECLCKLVGSVGKDLESENEDMNQYFEKMCDIINSQVSNQISLRVRFMLQDVIELRANKWSISGSNTETVDLLANIEAEKERLYAMIVHRQNDVKLRETDNPWRRGQKRLGHNNEVDLETKLMPSDADEEDIKTEALYKRVRGILNKLTTPQKFNTFANQVRALQIDSQERRQGVVDLMFKKAVNEPNYSEAYALMCKELDMMSVSGTDTKAASSASLTDKNEAIVGSAGIRVLKDKAESSINTTNLENETACGNSTGPLNMEQIHEQLLCLMSNEMQNSTGNISTWISANVGDRASEPQFITALMNAILKVSIEPHNNSWKLSEDKFKNLQTLIFLYVKENPKLLEAQCLIAIQEYVHKLEDPSGLYGQICAKLNIITTDALMNEIAIYEEPTTYTQEYLFLEF